MTPIEAMQKHYLQRDLAAREWTKNGGKVVGYFCDNVPEELILAAGFFPLRISGDPKGGLEEVGIVYENGRPFYREIFASSMLHRILTGEYEFMDYLVIPHARESVHRLYTALVRRKEANPELGLPEIHYLDNLHTTFYSSEIYNRARCLDLKINLEKWSEKKITDEALSKAITVTNESKILLKKVADIRAAEPPRISGVEALQIIGSSMFMLKEDHNQLLKDYLETADQLPAREGKRIFTSGSPLDHLQFYELIESCGAVIVGEDNCWGNRSSDVPIDVSGDPFEAIIKRYLHKSPCPRIVPVSLRVNYCVDSTLTSKAQGIIFNVFEFDNMPPWEIPEEIDALKEKGVQTLYFNKQPYWITETENIKEKIIEFIKSI
ncbi:2-hydroxyacyl-CoA dehydratase subunit D [Thermodesulfobacteriota bacterium]